MDSMSPSPRLIIFDSGKAQAYDLNSFDHSAVTFGRSPDNDIVITSPLVSRHHGFLQRENGRFVIVNDPESTNGLLYQERLIPQMELRDGDSIRIDAIVRSADASQHCEAERDPDGVLLLFSEDTDDGDWTEIPVRGQTLLKIGRDPSCEIVILRPGVSRLHAVIEQRESSEVTSMWYREPMAPEGIGVRNPAFDVTPAELITAIVTERGVLRAPYGPALAALFE